MDKKPLIGVCILAVVLLVLGSLSNVVGYQSIKSTTAFDSPLFKIKMQRAIHQQQTLITFQYLGKGFGNDTTPPITICILNPLEPDGENGWYVSKITVTLNATDDDSGVNITHYKLDGGAWQTYLESFTITLDGQHLLKYYSVDNAGNIEPERSITLALDKTEPMMNLTYTWEGNGLCKYVIIFSAGASDLTSGMNRVEFYINKVIQRTIVGPGPIYVWEYPSSYEVRGFILNPEILEDYVKFHARIVMISGASGYIISNCVTRAVAYDNAGNEAWRELYPPTFRAPIIKPGFYLFRDVTLPNNYTGYIGRFFIKATFYNT